MDLKNLSEREGVEQDTYCLFSYIHAHACVCVYVCKSLQRYLSNPSEWNGIRLNGGG